MNRIFLLFYFCTLLLFPLAAGAATVSDEFTRADSLTLGANWQDGYTGVGGVECQIVSGKVLNQAAGDACYQTWSANSFGNDQWGQITLVDFSAADSVQAAILLRATDPVDATWYRISARRNAAESTKLFKEVANVTTSLATENAVTWTSGDILYAEISGTTITVKRNGVTILTHVDASIASGRVGFFVKEGGTAGSTTIDSFSGGDLTVVGAARRRVAAMSFE